MPFQIWVHSIYFSHGSLAGILQIVLGWLKAGVIGYYFPTSVIKGMLAGIGVILIIKQIPYAFGVNETANLENTYHLSMIGVQFLIGKFGQ